jgi:hypothetical protein
VIEVVTQNKIELKRDSKTGNITMTFAPFLLRSKVIDFYRCDWRLVVETS